MDRLDLGIYDADILIDPERHPIPKKVGDQPLYRVRMDAFGPWIRRLREEAARALCRPLPPSPPAGQPAPDPPGVTSEAPSGVPG